MDLFQVSSSAQRWKRRNLQKEERESHSPEKSVKEKAAKSDLRRRSILKNKTQQQGSSEHMNSREKSRMTNNKRKRRNMGISSGSNKRTTSRNKMKFALDDSLDDDGSDGTNRDNVYDSEDSDIVILGETYCAPVKLDNSCDSNDDDIVFLGETNCNIGKSADGFESKKSSDQGKDVEISSEQNSDETDSIQSKFATTNEEEDEEERDEKRNDNVSTSRREENDLLDLVDETSFEWSSESLSSAGAENEESDVSKKCLPSSDSEPDDSDDEDFDIEHPNSPFSEESFSSFGDEADAEEIATDIDEQSVEEGTSDIHDLRSKSSTGEEKKSVPIFQEPDRSDTANEMPEICEKTMGQKENIYCDDVEGGECLRINVVKGESSGKKSSVGASNLQGPGGRQSSNTKQQKKHEEAGPKGHLGLDTIEEMDCSRRRENREAEDLPKSTQSKPEQMQEGDVNEPFCRKRSCTGMKNQDGIGFSTKTNQKQCHLSNVLIDSMLGRSCELEMKESCEAEAKQPSSTTRILPLKFRFEDEESKPAQESDYENMVEGLFSEMYTWMYADTSDDSPKDANEKADICNINENKIHPCLEGKHDLVILEDIGMVCRRCNHVEREMRHILPPFTRMKGSAGRKCIDKGQFSGALDFTSSVDNFGKSFIDKDGTVWDMIPGVKETMYQHQQDGFEFLWRNLEGTIDLEELKTPNSRDVGGCIISHAPGTGKTRLTIVFIQTYLKLFPDARPLIIAPASMLLTWEEEFTKWKVEFPFHNLNNLELSGKEHNKILGNISLGKSQDKFIRLVKMHSWNQEKSILGISYQLFEKLVGERYRRKKGNKKGQVKIVDQESENIRKILLEKPRLVILDEGHRPRSQRSCIWNTLLQLQTERRIILSGTLFQNNFMELFNTFHLVRPTIASSLAKEKAFSEMIPSRGRKYQRKRLGESGTSFTSSSAEEAKLIETLKERIAPFVHIHKGSILENSLLGLSNGVILLNPPPLQKYLIEKIESNRKTFQYDHEVALLSVHPSLLQNCLSSERESSNVDMEMLTRLRRDPNAGVKTRFIMELVRRSKDLNERVLIFSQYIQPTRLIKDQLREHFMWEEGKQIFEIHGKLDQKQRQCFIEIFNDPTSEAQVLLASIKCCSEGINLVGASRIVLLDVVWNPSVRRQAISRAYRLGQKKVVFTYHLITSGTTEGDKCCRQAEKDRFSELVFSSTAKEDDQQMKPSPVFNDRILKEMFDNAKGMFEKIIYQPNAANLVKTFGQLLSS